MIFGGTTAINQAVGPPYPSITTTMKRFFKINHKKSPKPPRQPIPPEKPADIAARPSDPRAELNVPSPCDGGQNVSDNDLESDHTDLPVPRNEGGRIGPRVLFQDGVDGDQELLGSEGASTSVVAIGGAECGSQLDSKCFRFLRWNICAHLCLSTYQPRAPATREERSGQRRHPRWVCEHINDDVGPHLPCASCKENS